MSAGEVRTLTLPFSEVNMFMGVAGKTMEARHTGRSIQLLDSGTGRPFAGPITVGEAGWGMVGFDHTLTTWDDAGLWHRRAA